MAKKILVIEDDLFLGDLLAQKCRGAGYDIVVATDGQSGLEKITSFKPDIVLLDIILPIMSGLDVLKAKAKDDNISKIPVIIVTNSGDQNDKNAFTEFGVREVLVKAKFDPSQIVKHIDMIIGESMMGSAPAQIPIKETVQTPPISPNTINLVSPTRPIIIDNGKEVVDIKPVTDIPVANDVFNTPGINPAPATPAKTSDDNTLLKQKKIMWVEDDKFLSDLISRKLSNLGCNVVYAETGEIALSMIEKEKPDILMLDILLPGITGIEVLEKVKANAMISKTPVIMLSNFSQESDIKKSLSLGAVKYLVKATVTLDEIVAEIRNILLKNGGK